MVEEGDNEPPRSSVSVTARNALAAAAVGFAATVILGIIVTCARIAFDLSDGTSIDLVSIGTDFVMGIPGFFLCVGPIVFVPAFAILQRMKFGG